MSDFNAAQVLAEAYTLYKKHHNGMGLDFKIAIAQAQAEAKAEALRDAAESDDLIDHMYANLPVNQPIVVRETATYLHNRADQEGDK